MIPERMLKDFIIKFKGLSTGFHEFNYVLDSTFFDELKEEEIKGGNIKLQILLNKEDTMLTFDFSFKGNMLVECDRCLDDLSIPVEKKEKLYVKFSDNLNNEIVSDEIIYLKEEDYQINLFDFIRESVLIALPLKKVHSDDKNGNPVCNPDMLARIKAINTECANGDIVTDPRWDKLKEIKQI